MSGRACSIIGADRKSVRCRRRRDDGAALRRRLRELAQQRRRSGSRRRAVGVRGPLPVAAGPNQRWSLDFVHDQLVGGGRFRVLSVMDDVTRECLAAVVDTSISGRRVARELAALSSDEAGRL